MLYDIKSEVVKAAKTPDCNAEQRHDSNFWMLHNKQRAGKKTNNQKENTLHLNPTRVADVFHILMGPTPCPSGHGNAPCPSKSVNAKTELNAPTRRPAFDPGNVQGREVYSCSSMKTVSRNGVS